jgi:ferredoxin--NADP+ reductase
VAALLGDLAAGRLAARGATRDAVDTLLAERGVEVVGQAGWEAIDHVERARGEPLGRPRVKLCGWDDLLTAARRA